MTIRTRVLIRGAVAGACGAAALLTAVAVLDRAVGGILGALAATARGALGAWLGAEVLSRRVADHLAALEEGAGDGPIEPPPPLGWGQLDPALNTLRDSLARSSRFQAEAEAIER